MRGINCVIIIGQDLPTFHCADCHQQGVQKKSEIKTTGSAFQCQRNGKVLPGNNGSKYNGTITNTLCACKT